jgi:pimeloyl-ACP methyl ester carboxylesterase
MVHGLGVSGRYMLPIAVRLCPAFPVAVPDLPGFGWSARPAHPLDVPGLADALAGWMRAWGWRAAALLGNSLGCQVIVDCALRYPGMVASAVLVCPTVDVAGRTALRQLARALADGLREPPSLLLLAAREYLAAGVGRDWRTFRYALRDPLEEKLPHVQVPTLVVAGGRDPIVPLRWAEEVARRLPRGRLAIIPSAPHAVNYSAPAELVRHVRPFLLGDVGSTVTAPTLGAAW